MRTTNAGHLPSLASALSSFGVTEPNSTDETKRLLDRFEGLMARGYGNPLLPRLCELLRERLDVLEEQELADQIVYLQ